MQIRTTSSTLALVAWAMVACDPGGGDDHDDHDDDHDHETEVISRVELTFTPSDGGDAIVAAFSDPDGDGGVSGTSEPVVLAAGAQYTLSLGLFNDLEDPVVDIGEEVEAEAEEHMVLITDDGGLLTVDYADLESDYGANEIGEDLPLGMVHEVAASSAGTSSLRVILRHLPALNDEPQKRADLPEMFANGEALPGDVDVDVSFELTVQ